MENQWENLLPEQSAFHLKIKKNFIKVISWLLRNWRKCLLEEPKLFSFFQISGFLTAYIVFLVIN